MLEQEAIESRMRGFYPKRGFLIYLSKAFYLL